MKKTALALTFALCLTALCGCGESSSSAPAPEANSSSAAATEAPKETAKETMPETTKATTKATEAKKDESSSNGSKLKLTKYSPCVKIGNTYQSLCANFKFKAPESWTYLADDEMLEMVKTTSSEQANTGMYNSMEDMKNGDWLIYDAWCFAPEVNGFKKNIVFRFINEVKEGNTDDLPTSAYMEFFLSQIDPNAEVKKVSFANQEYQYFTYKDTTQNNVTCYGTKFMRSMGKYLFLVDYASTEDDFETLILPNMGCMTETPFYQ